ncbi:CPXCG motif-containing cysteine-rich protein [Oceanospirillum sp.]|uniref:CPXCG motif-containing cysteine-rich protein n=1 Tax=Oceanospirillum sp. TaxID=2021254 RepID=UPI003A91ADD4
MLETMLTEVYGQCPYCGSELETAVDISGGDQDYYEDCQTCCAPIHMQVYVNMEGELLSVELKREDDP